MIAPSAADAVTSRAERPHGVVSAVASDAGLVVRMSGDVDLSVRRQLLAVAKRLAEYGGPAIVDLTDVTFCDGTLAGFLADAIGQETVTVHAPTLLTREVLTLYGVDRGVRVLQ